MAKIQGAATGDAELNVGAGTRQHGDSVLQQNFPGLVVGSDEQDVTIDGKPAYKSGVILEALSDRLRQVVEDQIDETLGTTIDPKRWSNISGRIWVELDRDLDLKAEFIKAQITTRCRHNSAIGMRHAVIMSIAYTDLKGIEAADYVASGLAAPVLINEGRPDMLEGVALDVWQHMVRESTGYDIHCQPTMDRWAEMTPDGKANGFNLVAHFNESTKAVTVPVDKIFDEVMNQIPRRGALEALLGRDFAEVFSFEEGDINFLDLSNPEFYSPGKVRPEALTGPASEIFNRCEELGLKPTLEYWECSVRREDDDLGLVDEPEERKSGYSIIIHWYDKNNQE